MAQDTKRITQLINFIFDTHPGHEIDCEACNREFHCLAEKVAAGASVYELLPTIAAHLDCCGDCREEFEALVAIVKAEDAGLLDTIWQDED